MTDEEIKNGVAELVSLFGQSEEATSSEARDAIEARTRVLVASLGAQLLIDIHGIRVALDLLAAKSL